MEFIKGFLMLVGFLIEVLIPLSIVVFLFKMVYFPGTWLERIIAVIFSMMITGSVSFFTLAVASGGGCILAQCSQAEMDSARFIFESIAIFYAIVTVLIPIIAFLKWKRNP